MIGLGGTPLLVVFQLPNHRIRNHPRVDLDVSSRHRACCATKLNRERWVINDITRCHVILKVEDHAHRRNERQTKKHIDCNILTSCNGDEGVPPIRPELIGQMEHESAIQNSSDRWGPFPLNNA